MQQNIMNMFSIRAFIFTFAALLFSSVTFAQDSHYTQYNLSPLTLNPSLTGSFEGTFRVGVLYRDQWRSVIGSNAFATPSVYIDVPINGFGKRDWIGLGVSLLNDRAGTVALTRTRFMGSLAYHIPIGSKGNTVISLGGQAGLEQRRVDKSAAETEESINAGTGAGSGVDLMNNIGDDKISFGDYNAGLTLRSKLNKNLDFTLGFSMLHLSQPEYTLYSDATAASLTGDEKSLSRTAVGHAQFNAHLTPKWTLSPSFLYQAISSADEVNLQLMAGHHFNEEKDITLNFGTGYRLRDAVSALVGFDYKGFKLGVAYDFNVSDLSTASANRGGFELAASYIAKIRKPVVVKPVIFCPRF
ncbi:MAG: type IX secretion system PorP/SprF family membrane protein [Maribacter sp.]|jgi:type IX secretion system PorP/SprF family membrane protein